VPFPFSTFSFFCIVDGFLMVLAMDGDLLDGCLLSFVAFLFGLFLVLDKLQAFALGDATSNACSEAW
jgi:hypothetical protein